MRPLVGNSVTAAAFPFAALGGLSAGERCRSHRIFAGWEVMRAMALATLLALSSPASALPCDSNIIPMPEPQRNEVGEPPVADVEAGCMIAAKGRASLIGTHLRHPSFAHSQKWGDEVRMDIGAPNPSVYSRIVCFRMPDTLMVQMGLYILNDHACDGHIAGVTLMKPPAHKF